MPMNQAEVTWQVLMRPERADQVHVICRGGKAEVAK